MTLPKTSNNIENNQNISLSVQVSLTGHSFLLATPNENTVHFFSEKNYPSTKTPEDILEDVKEEINSDPKLQKEFNSVKILFENAIYTVVPLPLFDENKASEYLKFNTKILANDYIAYDTIEEFEIVVVYVPFVNVNNYFFEKFGEFSFYHTTSILLKSLLFKNKFSVGNKVFLNISQNSFDCIVMNGSKLLLCNTYSFSTPEDLIYYVLFVMEQLKLNPDSIETKVFGEISKTDDNFEILYKYIRNVSLYDEEFLKIETIPTHKHIPLKMLLSCE